MTAPLNPSRGRSTRPRMSAGLKCAYFAAVALVGAAVILVVVFSVLPQFDAMTSKTTDKAQPRVVIVGGGLAGLSAAVEASRHGAWVTIIEKEKSIGGNSAKATSGINAVGTSAQRAKDIEDSIDAYIQDTLKSGDGLSNEDLVNILATNSAAAIDFLESFDLHLTDVVQLGGQSFPRTHRFPPTAEGKPVPVGWTLISALRKHVENTLKDTVNVLTLSTFKQLVVTDGQVTGLDYTDSSGSVKAIEGAVILTSGGFANDHTTSSLLDKYVPSLAKLPTTNGVWATGDIIKGTTNRHLNLIHMDKVQVHPTGFIEPSQPLAHTKFLAPEALRGCGAILLDAGGKRFVNELGRRDHVTGQMMQRCKPYKGVEGNPIIAAMLLTQGVIDRFGAPSVGFYRFKGLIEDVGTLEKVAEKLSVGIDVLRQTLAVHRAAAERGSDVFGKKFFPIAFRDDDHFFVAYVTPSLHYCMGGLKMNVDAEVQWTDGGSERSVPGLYAAGEVTGGVHGNNRLGGNSLLECVVFGRIAGQRAAHYV